MSVKGYPDDLCVEMHTGVLNVVDWLKIVPQPSGNILDNVKESTTKNNSAKELLLDNIKIEIKSHTGLGVLVDQHLTFE